MIRNIPSLVHTTKSGRIILTRFTPRSIKQVMRSFPNWVVLMKITKIYTVVGSIFANGALVDFQTRVVFRKTNQNVYSQRAQVGIHLQVMRSPSKRGWCSF